MRSAPSVLTADFFEHSESDIDETCLWELLIGIIEQFLSIIHQGLTNSHVNIAPRVQHYSVLSFSMQHTLIWYNAHCVILQSQLRQFTFTVSKLSACHRCVFTCPAICTHSPPVSIHTHLHSASIFTDYSYSTMFISSTSSFSEQRHGILLKLCSLSCIIFSSPWLHL